MILILLTILKIIGIIFLVLLGLIVLLFCLILLAPVKYRAKGAKHPDDLSVSASVSYLWPLIRVKAEYPSETVLSVKILWMNLLHPKEKQNKKKKKPVEKRKQEKPERKTAQTDIPPKSLGASLQTIEMNKTPEAVKVLPDEQEEYAAGQSRETGGKSVQSDHGKAEKKASQKAAGKASGKASGKAKSASRAEKDTENKLIAIVTLILQYREMYPDVLGRVFHALKSILPRKCHIHLIFGTGSPDNTGYLYGAYCALQEYLPGTIIFEPVWMESYLDVEFELSGKIRLIHFVTAAVKIVADKRVRKFISEIRRL